MADDFELVAEFRDTECPELVCRITRRLRDNGFVGFSFAVFKEFLRNGNEIARTSYLNDRHFGGVLRLLQRAQELIEAERETVTIRRTLATTT